MSAEPAGCLHELFEAQVDLRPDAPAILGPEGSLSYAELEARSNRLARFLRSRGAGPGRFVALYFERSAAPIVAILGCLKAGAAYVPLDPACPADRIRHILCETEPVLLVSEMALARRAPALDRGALLCLDDAEVAAAIGAQPERRLDRAETGLLPEHLCYVIYTSGTTGRPKGVMAEHRNSHRYVRAFNEVCATGPQDRVYQGFSLGFDGSVEEIWMALSNGSALVVGGPDTPRFGDELGRFLSEQGVTYLSTVPTALSTVTCAVPTLRLLVLSGEVCPPELVNRWARPGLRLLNVYGPTEATVNTTCAECRAGAAVTIGRPLPGYQLHVLDEERRPVPRGEKGELYIAGATLSRGYLRQPELTAERFVTLGDLRLYRTGDLVRQGPDGDFEFFGRIDSQVKIRGYRVELAEIESVLLEEERIRSASVKLLSRDGLQELAAYVLLRDPARPLGAEEREGLLGRLQARLPPYMIPSHLDVLPELPMLQSGKVDRARLPAPLLPLCHGSGRHVEPATGAEATVAALWARIFGLPRVSVADDFFHQLGGHSLLAAQMVTQLRRETGKQVTVRDAYQYPTVRRLAAHLAALPERRAPGDRGPGIRPAAPSARQVFAAQPRWQRAATATLQALSLYLLYGAGAGPLALLFLWGRGWVLHAVSTARFLALLGALTLLSWPALLLFGVAAKWLLIGRYRPGSHPLWGFYYFRWWLASRLQALSGAGALAGTPLLPIYYRLMGARVGRGCTLDTARCSIWDLVRIGDDTSIGADTQLLGYRVEGGMLHLGRVEIGSRCFVGIHSALGLDVRMEDDARLDDQSLLPDRHAIAAGEARRGSPAQPAPVPLPDPPGPVLPLPRRRPLLVGAAQLALLQALPVLSLLTLAPLLALLPAVFRPRSMETGVALDVRAAAAWLLGSVPLSVLLSCLLIGGLKRLVLPRVQPGVYAVGSALYVRKWFSDSLMRLSRALLLPLYTTLYLPPWLRLLGAKIGPRAELSTVWHFSPELIDVGAESFFADGSIIGGRRVFRGRFAIGMNRIGRRSFVGNSAVLPVGASLGDRCLLGVQSIPPAGVERTPDGSEWLGSPSFALPHRPKVGNFDGALTYHPTPKLYLQRALVDGLRILLPGYLLLSAGIAGVGAMNFLLARLGIAGLFAAAPLLGIGLALYVMLAVAGLKKLVMGTFKPVIRPLWSPYVWLNELVNGAYESVMAPALGPMLGTPFAAPLLRLLGCRIGRHVFVETTLFSEFDLVQVGDHAALNAGAVIQNHLFEDRVMKSSYLKIGDECSVGNMAVVLYDSEMQQGAVLGPLSLLMKGETLAPFGRWHGIPSAQEPEAQRAAAERPAQPPAQEDAA